MVAMSNAGEPSDPDAAREWRRLTLDRPALATLPAGGVRGWVLKLSANVVSPWSKRYVVIVGEFLCYFGGDDAAAPCLGAYYLPGAAICTLASLPSMSPLRRGRKQPHGMLVRPEVVRRPGGRRKDLVLSLPSAEAQGEWIAHAARIAGGADRATSAPPAPIPCADLDIRPLDVDDSPVRGESRGSRSFADGLVTTDSGSRSSSSGEKDDKGGFTLQSVPSAAPKGSGRRPLLPPAPLKESLLDSAERESARQVPSASDLSLGDSLSATLSGTHVLNEYRSFEPIGAGGHATVYRAVRKADGREVALKRFAIMDPAYLPRLENEVMMMKTSTHKNIVAFHATHMHDGALWMAMEFMDAGHVTALLRTVEFTERHIAYVCRCVLEGLAYLHGSGRIHRDIKSDNVLINAAGDVKLGDFGFCTALGDGAKRRTVIGTPYWMAPEVIQGQPYNEKADMWSVGILTLEMCDGEAPLLEHDPTVAVFKIVAEPPPRPRNPSRWSAAFLSFVESVLQKEACKRPSAAELLEHPFLRQTATRDEFIEDAFM
eukprot:TRINITY_DN1893_c0_g1_i1.p1 TRINITY_DN1893_c0_g1~~TRINITY_DN1893_c0_g1_i1.p1  ORF type:complete len:544 (+),score=154.61 TRINITY_DN1893_c0_g1_i1:188-1819(+)